MRNYYTYTFALTIKYLSKYPVYWVSVFFRTIYYLLEIAIPVLFGFVINKISSGEASWTTLLYPVSAYAIIKSLNPIIEVSTGYYNWNRGAKVGQDYRRDMIELISNAKPNYFQNKSKGQVLSAINTASGGLGRFAALLNQDYFGTLIDIVSIIVASFIINPWVLVILLVNFIFFIVNLVILTQKEKRLNLIENQKNEIVYGRITEFLNNFTTVLYLNLFEREKAEIQKLEKDYYQALTKREIVSIFQKWLNNHLIHGFTQAILIIFLVNEVINHRMDIGTLSILVLFAQRVLEKLNGTVQLVTEYVGYCTNIERAYTLVNQELQAEIKHDEENEMKSLVFESLDLQSISLIREDRETLQNISLSIQKNQKIAIVGFTGSGKSTLMDVVLKVETNFTGNIFLNKKPYDNLSVKQIGQYISIVPQSVQLFRDTIENNIKLSSDISDIHIQSLIKVCNLEKTIANLPSGINTSINESNTNLSGGERQRIGIARSLAQNRPILILDEATASLDPKTERTVVTNIIDTFPELTLLFVTHKYSLLNLFDKIIVLNEGKIVENGSFAQLTAKDGLFKDLYNSSLIS